MHGSFPRSLSLSVLFWAGILLSPLRRTSVFTHLERSLVPSARHVFFRADRVSHCSFNSRPPQGHRPGVSGRRVRRPHHPHCGNHDQVTHRHATAAAWFPLNRHMFACFFIVICFSLFFSFYHLEMLLQKPREVSGVTHDFLIL